MICNNIIDYRAELCFDCHITNIRNNPVLNPNYIDGRSSIEYPKEFNKQLKLKIRLRDNFTCQNCFIIEKDYQKQTNHCLDIHHIDYNKMNCKETNLVTLCRECNSIANGERDYWFVYYTYIIQNYKKENNYEFNSAY